MGEAFGAASPALVASRCRPVAWTSSKRACPSCLSTAGLVERGRGPHPSQVGQEIRLLRQGGCRRCGPRPSRHSGVSDARPPRFYCLPTPPCRPPCDTPSSSLASFAGTSAPGRNTRRVLELSYFFRCEIDSCEMPVRGIVLCRVALVLVVAVSVPTRSFSGNGQ